MFRLETVPARHQMAPWMLLAGLLAGGCAAATASQAQDLETALGTGQGPQYYWEALEAAGYQVTAVNYDTRDYVEYEIVRGDETFEVQIDLDENHLASEIAVVGNVWVANETADALERRTLTVPAGTVIHVQVQDPLSSDHSRVGQAATFTVSEPVMLGDQVAIPAGAAVHGQVTVAERAKRPEKAGRLAVGLEQMQVRGARVDIDAGFYAKGKGSHAEDARDIGIGAAVGAIAGAILEGGAGALAGIVVGGGGVFLATKGQDVELSSGTQLAIQLERSVAVPIATPGAS